jgi:hypothetical protein
MSRSVNYYCELLCIYVDESKLNSSCLHTPYVARIAYVYTLLSDLSWTIQVISLSLAPSSVIFLAESMVN